MFITTLVLALAAAGAGLPDDTRLYCVASDQTLQNVRTADDINAASPELIDADLGALTGGNALRVLGEAELRAREIALTRGPSLARIEELDGEVATQAR